MALSRFTSDISHEQLVQTVNEQLQASITSMHDMVQREVKATSQGPSEPPNDSLLALVSPTFLLKVLCVGGVIYGALRYFGYTLYDVQPVSKGSMRRTVRAVEDRIRAMQHRMDARFQELSNSVVQYKTELDAMRNDTTSSAAQVRGSMEHFAGQVHAMSESTQQLDTKMGKTEQGVRLLCTIVADNSPNSTAQLGLRSFAREGLLVTAPPLDGAPSSSSPPAPVGASGGLASHAQGSLSRTTSLPGWPGMQPPWGFSSAGRPPASISDMTPQRSTTGDRPVRRPPLSPLLSPLQSTGTFTKPLPKSIPSSASCPDVLHGGAHPEPPAERQGSPPSPPEGSPFAGNSTLTGGLQGTVVSSPVAE